MREGSAGVPSALDGLVGLNGCDAGGRGGT